MPPDICSTNPYGHRITWKVAKYVDALDEHGRVIKIEEIVTVRIEEVRGKMNRDEAIHKVAMGLYGRWDVFWLRETEKVLRELPFLALVDRAAKPEEYKTVTEDKYDQEGNWTKGIKIQVPKSIEELFEGWVKELK